MCFKIDEKAKRPNRKVAYKVVRITPTGYLSSTTAPMFTGRTHYWSAPGATIRRSRGHTSEGCGWTRAKHGIYVYQTLAAAKRAVCRGDFILKVFVSPADWLFSSLVHDRMSTYEKVVIAKRQPYFDWD